MRKYFECVERYRYVDPQAREESDELLLSWRTWLKRRLADFDSYIFEADARVFWNILADSVHWAESIVGRMAESAWWKNAQHGFAGWLPVNQAPLSLLLRDKQLINIVRSCVDTALTYGLEPITWRFDPNHWIVAVERREGLLRTPMATDGKKRRGVREYLVETQKHYAECLTIETHALATKILFQDCDPLAADGVEYRRGAHLYAADPKSAVKETEERDGLIFVRHPASRLEEKCEPQEVLCKAKAKKEVILAAGAFNTPQLLMLSGIGPEEELRKHNICVRKSLPGVGGNLQDRYEVGVITELENNFTVLEDATFSDSEADLAFLDWKRGEGLYTTNGAVLGIIKRSKPERLDPDLFIFGAPGHFNGYYPHWSQDAYAYKNRFSWVILKAHTNNNAGTVRLTSCRPEDTPDINFRYFDEGNDDGEDLTSVLEGIKFVRQINKRVENRVLIRREIIPGDSVRDDQQLREFIKNNAWGHHACGTCKMGPPDDPLAVVDGQFRVYGVKNLRIVDASIFPKIPGFFIVSAIYMISEKASAALLGDARPAASCGNRLEAPGRVACER
jgi:choline dehydrogenase